MVRPQFLWNNEESARFNLEMNLLIWASSRTQSGPQSDNSSYIPFVSVLHKIGYVNDLKFKFPKFFAFLALSLSMFSIQLCTRMWIQNDSYTALLSFVLVTKYPDHFSSYCISQTWLIRSFQSFWQYILLPYFNISENYWIFWGRKGWVIRLEPKRGQCLLSYGDDKYKEKHKDKDTKVP